MKRFFTLVELMVVIGIIVILAGILLPTLAGGRERATAAKCMSNMKQLGGGMALFASDNNNCLVSHDTADLTKSWAGNLLDYVKETKLYYCEADEKDSSSDKINIGKTCLVSYMANTNVHTTEDNKKIYSVERTTQTMSLGPRSGPDLGSINPPGTELERHGKTSNYLFVDGHTEAIKQEDFQNNDKAGEGLEYWTDGK